MIFFFFYSKRDERNVDKSRYRDVIPGELTRVKLQSDDEDTHDFINANYVSGYNNHEKGYIFTQGKTNKHTISINHQLDLLPRPRTIAKHCQRFLENDLARKYFDYRYDNEYS